MVGLGRLELPTSRLSGVRSNHLSYRPQSIEPIGLTEQVHGPARACKFTAEERETKEADPAIVCRNKHDLFIPYVLKKSNS